MNWPSGDPNQPQYPRPQYPPDQYPPPAYAPPPPPPMPYRQPSGQPPGGYLPPAPKKSRKVLIIVLSVLAVLVLGGIATVSALVYFAAKDAAKDKVVANELATGDCLADIPTSTLISVVPKVDCSTPHSGEVYAVLQMPDGDYPGEATVEQWKNKCPPDLQSYSPSAGADPAVGVFVLYPTADTWAKGDRVVTCVAATEVKRTGSVKG